MVDHDVWVKCPHCEFMVCAGCDTAACPKCGQAFSLEVKKDGAE